MTSHVFNRLRWLLWLSLPLALAGCGLNASQSNTMQIQMAIYKPVCLEVKGASMAEGQTIWTYPCIAGERRQVWSFVQVDGTSNYRIINTNSLQCMTVTYGLALASTPVIQAPCYLPALNSQLWAYVPSPIDKGYELTSAVSGLCLDVPYGETTGESPMQVYTCDPMGSPSQSFNLQAVTHGTMP